MKLERISPRNRSLIITHVANAVAALGSGMIITGVWPYLQAVSGKLLFKTTSMI